MDLNSNDQQHEDQHELTLSDVIVTRGLRVQSIYNLTLFSVLLHTGLALAYGGLLWNNHNAEIALYWAGAFVLLAVARVTVLMMYRRFGVASENQNTWIMLATLMMFLTGIGWGASAMLFMSINPPETILMTSVLVAAVAVTGIILLAPLTLTMIVYASASLGPLVYQFMAGDAKDYWYVGLLIILILVGNICASLYAKKGMMESLRLLVENKKLAEDAERSRDSVTEANNKLTAQHEQQRQTEEALRQAKIDAEAAVMAKGEFLATMSHEIRTPLNGILPILDILRSTDLDPTQLDYLQTAFSSSKHLLSIIDDILDYSKIEAGKLELEDVGLNLKELLDSVSRLMTGSANKKGLELRTRIEPGVRLATRGDPVRLRQVLTNLVSNAIKFTDSGFVDISIKQLSESRTHNELLFRVRDSGIGMDDATAGKLFKPFSQANASTTRTYGGSGLGLAICKRIIDLMDGKIGVKSESGRGSVFWFLVKLKKSAGDIVNQKLEVHRSKVVIACADDALEQRLSVFIQGWGTETQSYKSLSDLVTKLEKITKMGSTWQFDVLVIDADSMGEQSYELIRKIKQNKRFEEVCILALNREGQLPAGLPESARLSVQKRDISQGSLHETIEKLLNAELKQEIEKVTGSHQAAYAETSEITSLEQDGVKPKVLLVEDNPVNLHVAQKLMQILGCDFDIAKNGKEGLDRMKSGKYNIVLMDCMMPVMDGYTATREWRNYEELRSEDHLPIIAMTANAMAGDRKKCLDAGMDDYMAKPLNKLLVGNMIKKWARAGQSGSQTAQPMAAAQSAAPKPVAEPARREHSSMQMPAVGFEQPSSPASEPAKPQLSVVPDPVKPAQQQAPASGDSVDFNILKDLIDIMGNEYKVLIDVYLEDTPKMLDQIKQAVTQNQINLVIMPAHSLKSTSANLGALKLSEIAKRIELSARQNEQIDFAGQLKDAYRQFENIKTELIRYVALQQ